MARNWRRAGLVLAVALLGASFGAVAPAGASDVAARVTTFENVGYTPGPGGGRWSGPYSPLTEPDARVPADAPHVGR